MKDNISETRQHRFTKRKSGIAKVIAFYDEIIGFVDKKTSMDIIYLNFNTAFNTVSLCTPVTKLKQ